MQSVISIGRFVKPSYFPRPSIMGKTHPKSGCCGITRRGFLLGAGAGLAAGAPLGWLAFQRWGRQSPFTGKSTEIARAAPGMPGPFPGRVNEVRHDGALNDRFVVQQEAVGRMLARGMCDLTGSDSPHDAWRRFFERDDVVGIKVNPVGRRALAGEGGRVQGSGCISSPELLIEVVKSLKSEVGLSPRNIIVFERYAAEFRDAGYERAMASRDMDGIRWYASSHGYEETQLLIDGQTPGQPRDPKVVGYDPDVFVSMGFAAQAHDPRDDRRFRSHLSMIVTRMVNKIITVPCLKDHRSAGVTLALKNMSHGMNNNVARSHISGVYRLGNYSSDPNQCNTFIPTAVAQPILRQKATLHILDGLVGVYEGGPGNWNRSWGTWPRKSLFFATDPVAMDHVGWHIIDQKRLELGWAPVARVGALQGEPSWRLPPNLAALAAAGTPQAAAAVLLEQQRLNSIARTGEFDRRQPEHIALAGLLGLGRFESNEIEHRISIMR